MQLFQFYWIYDSNSSGNREESSTPPTTQGEKSLHGSATSQGSPGHQLEGSLQQTVPTVNTSNLHERSSTVLTTPKAMPHDKFDDLQLLIDNDANWDMYSDVIIDNEEDEEKDGNPTLGDMMHLKLRWVKYLLRQATKRLPAICANWQFTRHRWNDDNMT